MAKRKSHGLLKMVDEKLSLMEECLYAIFRSGTGLFFMKHGLEKLGLLGQAQPFLSLLWFAGVIETVVGLGLLLGVFSRYLSILGAATMVVAYAMVHLPKGLEGLKSGELAILYFLAFLAIAGRGDGKWSAMCVFGRSGK